MFFTRCKYVFMTAYKLLKIFIQVVYGMIKMSKLPRPIISIFGGSHFKNDDYYFKQAHSLARRFVANQVSVLTGGGGGIMQAANCGAVYHSDGKIRSIGIGVKDLPEGKNNCSQEYFELDYFFARKWLLTQYSIAFIVFPGGFGTLDELAEVLTLIQTKKMIQVPIILVGIEFWTPFMTWITDEALAHGLISQKEIELITLTDDMDEIFCIVLDQCAL